jgi:uncharacterized protein YbjT (DUF2867 family)
VESGVTSRSVFITGGTGYLGRALIGELLVRGHSVRALARAGSERRLPPGPEVVTGNALVDATFADAVSPCDTFVHLIGTPHPSPAKAQQFRDVDLVSVKAAAAAAKHAWISHFVYLSVAYPAPIMHEYIAVRQEGESLIRSTGMPATFLRPFYVLGPGHWWPYPLVPIFALMRHIPSTRDAAERLGPVSLKQMTRSLVFAVETPPATGVRALNAPEIRQGGVP